MQSQRISPAVIILIFITAALSASTIPARAAEIELGDTSMADGLASAFVIVRNDDQPRGYASLTIDCVFLRGGQNVGQATAELKGLKYHEHVAERLSTFIKGDNFDRANCTISNAQRAGAAGGARSFTMSAL